MASCSPLRASADARRPTTSGFEQPLEAMYRALLDPEKLNQGFLREDAFLAVIIISDEDDCSTEDNRMFSVTMTSGRRGIGCCASG